MRKALCGRNRAGLLLWRWTGRRWSRWIAGAVAVGIWILHSASVQAALRLHPLFSDNMVLQRGRPVPVWGWTDGTEPVVVKFQGQTVRARPKNGKWMVRLQSLKAGGPYTFAVQSGSEKIVLTNVLVGEVWICSGQSNMQWPLWNTAEGPATLAKAKNPWLRLYTVPRRKAQEPQETIDPSCHWDLCTPETARNFSAVAFQFGWALQKALGVPVGLIHTSWGGSPVEAWMSREWLTKDPDYRKYVIPFFENQWKRYEEALARWKKAAANAKAKGRRPRRAPRPPAWRPCELYNGMIAPLIPYAIAGAIWYQGESNAGRAYWYRRLFPDMIRNWRADWGQGDFPFLEVQLAPWDKNRHRPVEEILAKPVESDWAELREAQVLATRVLPKVGMVVITDVGDKDNIHPRRKQVVGERLALAARVIAYGEKIDGLSPLYRMAEFRPDGRVVIHFDYVHGPLQVHGSDPMGFAIAGPDRVWRWANARVEGETVVVWHPAVKHPVAVRFGWADYPVVNLYSSAGLPVSPFRTDDWAMVTAPDPDQP